MDRPPPETHESIAARAQAERRRYQPLCWNQPDGSARGAFGRISETDLAGAIRRGRCQRARIDWPCHRMQKIASQRGTGPRATFMSEHRATSSRSARATSSESAVAYVKRSPYSTGRLFNAKPCGRSSQSYSKSPALKTVKTRKRSIHLAQRKECNDRRHS